MFFCSKIEECYSKFSNKKSIVIFDSQTGNTEKVAKEAADALCCEIKNVRDMKGSDLSSYDVVILSTPHLGRRIMTPEMINFLEENHNIKEYALLMTSGLPIKRWFSNKKCINYFETKLNKKPIETINIKGFHSIAKTYKNRPNENDLLDAYLFAVKLYERI